MGAGSSRCGDRRGPPAPREREGLARPVLGPAAPAARVAGVGLRPEGGVGASAGGRRALRAIASRDYVSAAEEAAGPFSGRTAWARNLKSPVREFMRTETGSAAFLLAATVAALVWVNVHTSSYDTVWHTRLTIRVGSSSVAQDLRHWVDTGLMTFFFFVVGLEARREFDMGELRQRRRVALPVLAGLGGMAVPVGIYLVANAGKPSAHGWGVAMSTDTAFALGMLALVGRRLPDRLRAFMLTVAVVDDIVALVIIATVYSEHVAWGALLVAVGILAAILAVRAARVRRGLVYAALGVTAWVAVFKSGIDPIVVGLVLGLLTFAYPAARVDLERATDLFRLFREQPTPELEQSARRGLQSALSPNTLGIFVGYLVGKPVGITGGAWLVTKLSRGRLRPPVGWGAVAGAGAIAGIGFTVALLIANHAFQGQQLEEAKLG